LYITYRFPLDISSAGREQFFLEERLNVVEAILEIPPTDLRKLRQEYNLNCNDSKFENLKYKKLPKLS